ncbi:MAG: HYR domain-containing protein [Bacteroidales bacterium]|nr:HYR domain-containing protein [Bacteroidales bacterium]
MTVTVSDDELPVITCPADLTQSTDEGICEAQVTVPQPVVSDNCGIASLINSYTGTDDASGVYGLGTTVVTWEVEDIHGNVDSCSMAVTLVDEESPVLVCPADVVTGTHSGDCNGYAAVGAATLSDNCAVGTISNSYTGTDDASGDYPVGTTEVWWYGYDLAGNVDSCSMFVTVVDEVPPTILCPDDILQSADSGLCEAWVNMPYPLVYDNCGIDSIFNNYTYTADGSAVYTVGVTHVTWYVVDLSGNIDSCSMVVEIIDDQPPVITCPEDISVPTDSEVCYAWVDVPLPVVSGNCFSDSTFNSYNGTPDASDTYPLGTTLVTWFTFDQAGYSDTCQMFITVFDNQNPVIQCPSDIIEYASDTSCSVYVNIPSPFASDNCAIDSLYNDYTLSGDASAVYFAGVTPVQWIVYDIAGNSDTCVMEVFVLDTIPPTISCPDDIIQPADPGFCEAWVEMPFPEVADNCGVDSIYNSYTLSSSADAYYPVGETIVTWYVFDLSGNVDSCSMQVVIIDDQPASITCPENVTAYAGPDSCATWVPVPQPIIAGNCGNDSSYNDYNNLDDASDIYPVGLTYVNWYVVDESGNSMSCQMMVTVLDTIPPVISAIDTVNAFTGISSCSGWVEIPVPYHSDNCEVSEFYNLYTGTEDATAEYDVGYTHVVWIASDLSDNTTSDTTVVFVRDTIPPIITCPENMIQDADSGLCEAWVTVPLPDVYENCQIDRIYNTYNDSTNATAYYPVGTTTVTWIVYDVSGNVDSCSMMITVIDNQPPSITCPQDIITFNDENECGAWVNVPQPETAGNCGTSLLVNDYTGSDNASAQYPVGTTTVIWTVSDENGNSISCSHNIVVIDNEPPDISCINEILAYTSAFACSADVVVEIPLTSDNCAVESLVNDYTQTGNASGTYPAGTTKVQWMVTDSYGNAATCTTTVIVMDTIPPQIVCPDDIIQDADSGLCEAYVSVPVPVLDENCAIDSLWNSYTLTGDASAVYPVGITLLRWFVTDVSGNVDSCFMTVTVVDNQPPSITCPDDIWLPADSGECRAWVDVPIPVTAGNCDADSLINDYTHTSDASGYYPVGTTSVTWTAFDQSGNSQSCTMHVTVFDDQYPILSVPDSIIALTPEGECSVYLSVPIPLYYDNCEIDYITNNITGNENATSGYEVGVTPVYWETADIYGNISYDTTIVFVRLSALPEIICPENMELFNDSSFCGAMVSIPLPSVHNACQPLVWNDYNYTADASDYYPVGTTYVQWFVEDVFGNRDSCFMSVTIIDNEPPGLVCPGDYIITPAPDQCEAVVSVSMPTVFDNCGVEFVYNDRTGTSNASGTYPLGETVVNWILIDIYGNINECSCIIHVLSRVEAIDDEAETNEDVPVVIPVVENDLFCASDYNINSLSLAVEPTHGQAMVSPADSSFVYYPDDGFSGTDSFIYRFENTSGFDDIAVVTIVVHPVNHPPVASDDYFTTDMNMPVYFKPLDNDLDPDGNNLSVSSISPPINGDVEWLPNNEFKYSPILGYVGEELLTYAVCDDGFPVLCDTATILITITYVDYPEIDLHVYNALTPNGDGINDTWKIEGIWQFPENEVFIMDRWGALVRTIRNYNNRDNVFDGTDNQGRSLGNGDYYYILKLKSGPTLKGWVYLHR